MKFGGQNSSFEALGSGMTCDTKHVTKACRRAGLILTLSSLESKLDNNYPMNVTQWTSLPIRTLFTLHGIEPYLVHVLGENKTLVPI